MTNTKLTDEVEKRQFKGRRIETEEAYESLAAESQAALRQYSLERTVGYGVDYADAIELRARVLDGETWQSASTELADICLDRVERAPQECGDATRIAYLRRASALLRMSQAMMLQDTDERREIFAKAAQLYGQAADLAGDCSSLLVDTSEGPVAGWLHQAKGDSVASVMVIGGVEGWAMDFSSLGDALAARGIDAYMLDGPGQGQTRFEHRHYLTGSWRNAYAGVVDHLSSRASEQPIGFIGNSMGGSFAMAFTAGDRRIGACCNNGGPIAPWMAPQEGTFFSKMMSFSNTEDKEKAVEVWSTAAPAKGGDNKNYPLLLVHGNEDPLVSNQLAEMLFQGSPTSDKHMVTFSDGDHCIYRHKQDRDILMSDWMRARLTGQSWSTHSE